MAVRTKGRQFSRGKWYSQVVVYKTMGPSRYKLVGTTDLREKESYHIQQLARHPRLPNTILQCDRRRTEQLAQGSIGSWALTLYVDCLTPQVRPLSGEAEQHACVA